MNRKGLPRGTGDLTDDTAMLLALAAAKQASSATSMAQARLALRTEPAGGVQPRVALFASAGRSAVRGSFEPRAAVLIGKVDDRAVYRSD